MSFTNLLGNSFLFSPSNDTWKAKRRGLGHAFYKEKLVPMLENLKYYVIEQQKKWLSEIKESKEDRTTIDLSRDILRIQQTFFSHIIFGTNIDDIKVKILTKGKVGECMPITEQTPFEEEELSFMDATEIAF